MADQIKKLSAGHSIEVLDAIMTEVEEARGEHDNLGERLDEMSSDTPTPSTAAPAMDGTAAAGTSTDYARADHVHPSDTSRASATSEAEDRAALVELVDSGAKNIADLTSTTKTTYTTNTSHGVTITRSGDIFTVSGSSDTNNNIFFNIYFAGSVSTKIIPPGNWVALIEDYTGTVVNDIAVQVATPDASPKIYGVPIQFSLSGSESGNWLRVNLRPSTTYDGSFRLMICSEAAWNVSHTYVPYRPSYQEIFNWSKATDCLNDDATTNAYFDVQNSYVSVYTNTALQRVVINAHLVTSTAITAPLSPKAIALIPTTTPLPNVTVRSLTYNVILSKNNSNSVIAFATTADIASGETLEVQLEYTYF